MPGKRRRIMTVLGIVAAVLVVAAVALVWFGPRLSRAGVRVADPRAAKALGDELLASKGKTFVMFIAHPDDAEWWAGGTLAMLARDNAVILVLGTSGDAGNGGLTPGLGAIREELQVRTGELLGYTDVVFLRHPDGHLAETAEYPGEVRDIVARYKPDGVLTFDTAKEGPVYHHPDHEAAGRAALAAAESQGSTTLYFIHSSAPDVIVDFAPVAAKKQEALSIMWSYHDAGPFGWLNKLVSALGMDRRAGSFGGRTPFPEVGVEYGEQLRRQVVPAASGASSGA